MGVILSPPGFAFSGLPLARRLGNVAPCNEELLSRMAGTAVGALLGFWTYTRFHNHDEKIRSPGFAWSNQVPRSFK